MKSKKDTAAYKRGLRILRDNKRKTVTDALIKAINDYAAFHKKGMK